jgi:hypothetical protein
MKPSDGNSYRTAKLKVDARESKEYQEEHPVSIKKNSKSKANQEKEMVE